MILKDLSFKSVSVDAYASRLVSESWFVNCTGTSDVYIVCLLLRRVCFLTGFYTMKLSWFCRFRKFPREATHLVYLCGYGVSSKIFGKFKIFSRAAGTPSPQESTRFLPVLPVPPILPV